MAGKGGARPGAGRKSNKVKRLQREIAAEVLSVVDEVKEWKSIIEQDVDLRLKLDGLKYLTDRIEGKAAERIKAEVTGENGGPLAIAVKFVKSNGD